MEEKLILSGCLLLNKKKEILLLKRKDHNHYETPGGKVEVTDIEKEDKKTIDLQALRKTAERELKEELGEDIEIDYLKFFSNVVFTTPDGSKAVANKFTVNLIKGEPKLNEPDLFSEIKWISIKDLETIELSPDLKLIIPLLKQRF